MSLLGRLFGSKAAAPAPNTVTIPDDVAVALTADGTALAPAVVTVLRKFLEARSKAAEAGDPGAIPFWLDRGKSSGASTGGDIEDELRERVIQRHAEEDI